MNNRKGAYHTMQQLKERILKEGKVLPGNIIKVDGFLNHRIDTKLMQDIADEFVDGGTYEVTYNVPVKPIVIKEVRVTKY